MVNKEDKCYRKTIAEEHYVVVGEPEAFYLTHVSPPDGKGRSIAQTIFDKIKDTSLQDNLAAVGSDGTAVMTGAHNGATVLEIWENFAKGLCSGPYVFCTATNSLCVMYFKL